MGQGCSDTGDAGGCGGLGAVDSRQQTLSPKGRVLPETKDGEEVNMKRRKDNVPHEVPTKPEKPESAPSCSAGPLRLLPEPSMAPALAPALAPAVTPAAAPDSAVYRPPMALAPAPALLPVLVPAPALAPAESGRLRSPSLGPGAEVMTMEKLGDMLHCYVRHDEAKACITRLQEMILAQQAEMNKMQAEMQKRLQEEQVQQVQAIQRLWRDQSGMQKRLQEEQTRVIQDLREEVGKLKGWREQSEHKQSEMQKLLQDHSLPIQAEMQTSLQAHAKQLDQVVDSLKTGQQTASSALTTLNEDVQKLQGLQKEDQQENVAMLAKLREEMDARVKMLTQSQREEVDSEAARFAGLVGQLEEGLQGARAEMDERLKTLSEQLQCQREDVDREAARLAGLVGQLGEGLEGARADHTASSAQLSTLQADLQQQQQRVEEGALAASRLASEFQGLQDNAEGLRRLQSLTEQRRQEICILRRDVRDLQGGLGDVRDQMQVLSSGTAGTGGANTGVCTGTPSMPRQSGDASVASTSEGQGQPDRTPVLQRVRATATATAPQAREERGAPPTAPTSPAAAATTSTPTSTAAAHRDAAAAARQTGGSSSRSDAVTFTFGKHPDDEASRQITLDVEQQILAAIRNSAIGPEKRRRLVKTLSLQLHPDKKGGTKEAFQWFEEWKLQHYKWFVGEGREQP